VIASLIHVLLLPLVAAEARSHDEGGRCVAVHQRLAQLRAEIADVEREAKVACSPGVTPAAPPLPLPPPAALPPPLTPHLNTAAAARARQARPALPVGQSRPDVGVRMSSGRRRPITMSGGRRRQTSGTAPPPYAYAGLRLCYELFGFVACRITVAADVFPRLL
jgi:hypothetical protein